MKMSNDITQKDIIDKLVHEPARLMLMLHLYAADSADFIYLMHRTGLSRGNLSSHMSKLEDAGYLMVEKKFVDKIPCTLLSLSEKGRLAFKKYKATMIDILSQVD